MKQTVFSLLGSIALVAALAACDRSDPAAPSGQSALFGASQTGISHSQVKVFKAAGDITTVVNDYRDALGNLNANVPGSLGSGRREINWDAVPALFTNTNNFPADFFNQPVVGRARGAVFSTPGTGFRTSDQNFGDVSTTSGAQFVFFSPIRTFAPLGSSEMTTTFFVPGSNVPANTKGFGVVFCDVDRNGSASIRLFDAQGHNLGRYVAPASDGGVSFVGVVFPNAVVARVEIESGQAAIDAGVADVTDLNGAPARDLVIMDDFIYGEPVDAAGATVATQNLQ